MFLSSISEAGGDRTNEDSFSIVTAGDSVRVGVFDGVTSLSDSSTPSAAEASLVAARRAGLANLHKEPADILLDINAQVRRFNTLFYKEHFSDPRMLAGVVGGLICLSRSLRTARYGVIGDVYIMTGTSDSFQTIVDDRVAPFSARTSKVLFDLEAEGIVDLNEVHARSAAQILENRMMANAPRLTGFGILNGAASAKRYIKSGEINLSDVDYLLIASDGMLPPLRENLDEKLRWIADRIVSHKDLAALLREIRMMEEESIKNGQVRLKVHDDATAVLVEF
jgi:hypothetical protein